ncbi:MAG: sigma-54 dependent transcriptional regulator [Candidatus Eisenbacteria bacterium]|uniref:Sigma-54 dependent transcriptional regulator n=1 Tax=Eiseniibacteriota bacterium TaxID=2212470 RepID=A0A948RVX2_UNCEI|nr:sigma-54 dependent transcriptional regulator [Candidatus Eisenbacteria bacterium]
MARLIHEESARRDQPFIRLNSAALPTELVESELFGHEAGAFTGATKRRKGKLEQAHEGTLFLDEVADMDLAAQAKLLRALGTGEVERVGGSEILHVDVRLVCATNRNLRAEVDAGRFREDLYFRICVIPIAVPALRDRNGDILELAEHFLARCCAENGRPPLQLEADARRVLQEHQWPGNVRELRNLMERLAIMHPTNIVSAEGLYNYLPPAGPSSALGAGTPRGEQAALADEDLGPAPAAGHAAPDADSESSALLKERLEEAEKKIIEDVLQRWGWNVTRAAEELGVDRATLHRRTRRLGVQRPRPDASD